MALVETEDLISISEANKLGVSGLIRDAEQGRGRVVLRNNRPVAVVMGVAEYDRLQQIRDDLLDVSLALARVLTTGPERHSLDSVLAQFGYSREDLSDSSDE
ncbi:MAG TPA: type II toxin-antitoxin system Phd/YefM family antitoxin [Chloroflexota bacterium]|nr:type II toxin-antitoxin system Phd/YefM family antitoxin [Chloroflexota bacterium]